MLRFLKRHSKKTGQAPGTLQYIGERPPGKVRISYIDYTGETITEREAETPEECFPLKDTPTVSWINVDGIHDTAVIEKLGEYFGLHPLVMEDIVHTGQRPKFEDMGGYIFLVLKMFYLEEDGTEIKTEQVGFVLGKNYVLSFQEYEGDVFDGIRERLRSGKGRIRKNGADYLCYTLMDAVVDSYFPILERLAENMEILDDELLSNPEPDVLNRIYALKRELIFLRKSIWPLREVISGLERSESGLIKGQTGVFLRDVYDHTFQVIDTVESFREVVGGMLDTYLSGMSNRMNEVMKILTIFAALFIPLTFLAGIYGMNFQYMPELGWKWSYPAFWGVIIALGSALLCLFKKKKWF